MLENWQNWCRFCAIEDSSQETQEESDFKMEPVKDQLEIINRLFKTSLIPIEAFESSICSECSSLLAKLEPFYNRCLRVDQMYQEILLDKCNSDADLQNVRIKYGVDGEETKCSTTLTNSETEKDVDDCSQSDHTSSEFEGFEAEGEDSIDDVKEDIEEEVVETSKKRGRPRGPVNKTQPTRQAKVKAEKAKINRKSAETTKKTTKEIRIRDRAERYRGPRSAREQPSICEICSKTYTRKYMLTLHIREKHSGEELPYGCPTCSKRFVTAQKLKVHEVSHLSKEEKLIHPCPHCGKLYGSTQNVEIHIRAVHKNEKPFICEECGKSFVTKGALKEHHISHSDDRSFQCSHCPKRYKSLPRLKMHEDIHTTTVYECPTCGVTRNTKHNLKMHMLVHSEEKKFKCKYCGNEFKRIKSFKDHLILHTGQRPYECPFCSKTFANGSNCRKHKKVAHPAELAALEASGEPAKVTILPKLELLQAKDCN